MHDLVIAELKAMEKEGLQVEVINDVVVRIGADQFPNSRIQIEFPRDGTYYIAGVLFSGKYQDSYTMTDIRRMVEISGRTELLDTPELITQIPLPDTKPIWTYVHRYVMEPSHDVAYIGLSIARNTMELLYRIHCFLILENSCVDHTTGKINLAYLLRHPHIDSRHVYLDQVAGAYCGVRITNTSESIIGTPAGYLVPVTSLGTDHRTVLTKEIDISDYIECLRRSLPFDTEHVQFKLFFNEISDDPDLNKLVSSGSKLKDPHKYHYLLGLEIILGDHFHDAHLNALLTGMMFYLSNMAMITDDQLKGYLTQTTKPTTPHTLAKRTKLDPLKIDSDVFIPSTRTYS